LPNRLKETFEAWLDGLTDEERQAIRVVSRVSTSMSMARHIYVRRLTNSAGTGGHHWRQSASGRISGWRVAAWHGSMMSTCASSMTATGLPSRLPDGWSIDQVRGMFRVRSLYNTFA
ncbi:MAG: hypothetical protein JXB07_20710, partial [Anaerolineae bacterium]|nr:hypothetical protein [Anaerolineae bacterium]